MGLGDVFRILIVPALVAAALYLLFSYLLVPLYRRHHGRYSQYLPLTVGTASFSTRITNTLARWLVPAHLRHSPSAYGWDESRRGSSSGEDFNFGEEEGENMVGFHVPPSQRSTTDATAPREELDSDRRLSRDLEEGFRDESSEDEGDDRLRR